MSFKFIAMKSSYFSNIVLICWLILDKNVESKLTAEYTLKNNTFIPIEDSCDVFIEKYSECVANYTSCVVLHSRPFTVCHSCYLQYRECQSVYKILTQTTTSSKELSCAQKIAHNDYVQMIVRMNDFIEDSWASNYCAGCYEMNNPSDVSNSTLEFLNRLATFNKCIFDKMEQHPPFIVPGKMSVNVSICSYCSSSYKNLSDFYSTIDPNFDGRFCMDLSDTMNFTWNLWHENFKCPDKKMKLTTCSTVSVILSVIPFLFYLLAKICGSDITKILLREKRLHPGWSIADEASACYHNS